MNRVKRLLKAVDGFQQRRPAVAFPVAVWKKFGDDQAGSLAALIAYYAFASIFPLLLVLVTVLTIVLHNNPGLQDKVLDDAVRNYPGIGTQLTNSVHTLHGTGLPLAIGLIGTLLGARGVANAAQSAFNTVWEVPLARRPGFPWSWLRSLGMILVVGIGEIITFGLSGVAGGAGHVISGAGAYVAAVAVSLALNIGLFWLAFRLATAAEVAGRDLWLGAVLGAIAWQILQTAGAFILTHYLAKSSSLYGTFGLVLGLLAWLHLQAEITLYVAEANVVRVRGLWPRSLFPPPLTEQDRRAYEMYAKVQQRRPEEDVEIRIPDAAEAEAAEGKPDARHEPGPGG
jgi:YihY family inner membrane protein